MGKRDYRDILAGALLLAVGGFALAYSLYYLNLGSFRRMGAGMFPALVGGIVVLIGAAILVPALWRTQKEPMQVDLRAFSFVMLSILAFALVLRPFGLIPGIVVMTLIASQADSKLGPLGYVVLPLSIVVVCVGIFMLGFGIQIDAFSWPW